MSQQAGSGPAGSGRAPAPPDGAPTWGVLLVVLGVVLLLQTTGVLPWDVWASLWLLWPLVLVVAGLNLLLGRRAPGLASLLAVAVAVAGVAGAVAISAVRPEAASGTLAEPLDGIESAVVSIDFGAGELTVSSLPEGSPGLVEGTYSGSLQRPVATLRRDGARGELAVAPERVRWPRWSLWPGGGGEARWSLLLARGPVLALEVRGGAARMRLDLRELRVRSLDLDVGAASVEVVAPATAGESAIAIDAGASSVSLVVPEGVAARIGAEAGLSSLTVDTSRFPRRGAYYESPGFESAEARVTVALRVGVASVQVR